MSDIREKQPFAKESNKTVPDCTSSKLKKLEEEIVKLREDVSHDIQDVEDTIESEIDYLHERLSKLESYQEESKIPSEKSIKNNGLLLLNVVEFAALKHKDQRRKNVTKDPYINHPIGVANLIATIGQITDVNVLCAALLHDTIEDTKTTKEEISLLFGKTIADTVSQVTDDKSLTKIERKKLQIQHAKEISHEAKLVKLGDKLHNLSSMLKDSPSDWSVEIIQGYFTWAKHVVDNLRGTNSHLEKELDKIFSSSFEKNGKSFTCLPDKPLEKALEEYYQLLLTQNTK